mmetsp:Transcript_10532/g.10601  ORF Transcript_10532/g.10601 Transcript_10532/m.10601 type:complete len:190 (+) Transcript_10532:210-779(+)
MGKSLYLFSTKNTLRRKLFLVVNSYTFEIIIALAILLSGLSMAMENPLTDPNSQLSHSLFVIDIVTTVIFTSEALIKIIAFGFVENGKLSYLRDGWNVVDFLIVLLSFASFIVSEELKMFKIIRVLKPFRIISRNQNLKRAVRTLFNSIPNFLTILMTLLLFFMIFAIIGVGQMKGLFHFCFYGQETLY